MAGAQRRGPPHPSDKNAVNFGHFPNARKDKTQYETFGQQNRDGDQVAEEGTCFRCMKHADVARD